MIREEQIILFNFPSSDRSGAKLRPALIIRQIPGVYDVWLICMISSQLGGLGLGSDQDNYLRCQSNGWKTGPFRGFERHSCYAKWPSKKRPSYKLGGSPVP
jgi:hypothetical protein